MRRNHSFGMRCHYVRKRRMKFIHALYGQKAARYMFPLDTFASVQSLQSCINPLTLVRLVCLTIRNQWLSLWKLALTKSVIDSCWTQGLGFSPSTRVELRICSFPAPAREIIQILKSQKNVRKVTQILKNDTQALPWTTKITNMRKKWKLTNNLVSIMFWQEKYIYI